MQNEHADYPVLADERDGQECLQSEYLDPSGRQQAAGCRVLQDNGLASFDRGNDCRNLFPSLTPHLFKLFPKVVKSFP
ncbi:MAG: hypothetical protein M5R38_17250 [Candidatus Methylomirabilis sp.]|nr:hypothetical protein [Candidatus Methylomirabilis sp.]